MFLVLAGCSAATNHEWMSFLFDGVPPLDSEVSPPVEEPVEVPKDPHFMVPAEKMSVHRPFAEGMCAKCHASREGKPEVLGSIFQGVPMLLLPVERLCFKCHEIEKKRYLHAPAISGQCVFCHEPHRTPNKRLLLMPSTRDLCARCHQGATFLTEDAHAEYGQRECIECHDPHSADVEFNLLPGVREGNPQVRKPTVSLPSDY